MYKKFIGENSRCYHGEYYEVMRYKDRCYLSIVNDGRLEPTTIEKIVEEINDICDRARAQGYNNDNKWLIVQVNYSTIYDGDGVFCTSSRYEKAIAFYDNGKVERI